MLRSRMTLAASYRSGRITFAGSQTDHAFAETGGNRRTPEDTMAREIEYGRTQGEPAGHGRTRDTAGSGPCIPRASSTRTCWLASSTVVKNLIRGRLHLDE